MGTSVRTAEELRNILAAKNISVTYRDLSKMMGVKVIASTPIKGSQRSLIAQLAAYRDQIPSTDAPQLPQGEVDAAPATSTPRAHKPGSIGELIASKRQSGFGHLTLKLADAWYPEMRGRAAKLGNWHVPTDDQRALLVSTFEVLEAVAYRLSEDRLMLDKWEVPNAASLIGQETYTYVGICGHQTQISRRMVIERLANQNSKVPPFFRLCAECRAERTALLNLTPLAAQADSVCKTCGDPAFTTGANGLAKSRADLWENLLSGVMDALNLPLRLRPEHLDSSGRHQALVRSREQFEAWVEEYTINVSLAISAHPEMGAELKARMAQEIDSKRVELNIPDSVDIKKSTKKAGKR